MSVLVVGCPVWAQVNIESVRRETDAAGTYGLFEFGLTLRAGNVELIEFLVSGFSVAF